MRRAACFLVAFVLPLFVTCDLSWAAADAPVAYRPPVDAPLVDQFRPPTHAFGPGNRGVDFATTPGTSVAAAADGQVVFAGQVGGDLHVVVLHRDGIRTSYSFLASVGVRRGQVVAGGEHLGTAGTSLHFGARAGGTYIDPMTLLAGAPPRVRLVPDGEARPASEATERSALQRMLRGIRAAGARVGAAGARLGMGAAQVGADALAWARAPGWEMTTAAVRGVARRGVQRLEELRGWLHYARALGIPYTWQLNLALAGLGADPQECTPPSVPIRRPPGRRLAVLVAGLGSAAGSASVLDVDTRALGYTPAETVQFSYRGGSADQRPYGPADTQVDIARSGRHLRRFLEHLQAQQPDATIDVIAHSQGGLVARSALGGMERRGGAARDGLARPRIGTLITLGTPHRGADLATALAMTGASGAGRGVQRGIDALGLSPIDPGSTSVRQMSETSGFLRELNARPPPAGVRAVSIAARGDLVVPLPRSRLEGAANVVVDVAGGLDDHGRLPGSPAARREMALALAGMPPGCRSLADRVADVTVGETVSRAEDHLGAGLAGGLRLAELVGARRLPVPPLPLPGPKGW